MFTIATAVSLEFHTPPLTVESKVVVLPTHIACVPVKVPADGAAVIVTVLVAVASAQPPVPVMV